MFASNTSQVSEDANYIESCFSTYLYTGNGSTQTITNGIDLSTYGGLVWAKMRSNGSATGNVLFDTARGASQKLETNTTGASSNWTPYGVSAFGSTGFTVADDGAGNYITNNSGVNYASWTFRKQPKFFDVVTYTGTGSATTIAHNLGSVPSCIIVKNITNGSANWYVYHQSLGNATRIFLNLTDASSASTDWNSTTPTSTVFSVGNGVGVNGSGNNYVAYLFAHNAGGFGLTGTDNVISCGSFVTGGGGKMTAAVNLGYEPQWLLIKNSGSAENWQIYDTMRGMSFSGYNVLYPNLSNAEYSSTSVLIPTATGFDTPNASGPFANFSNYIYIAIRRGPMKVPTSGTSVFALDTLGGTAPNPPGFNAGFPVDLGFFKYTAGTADWSWGDRLRGAYELYSNSTSAEVTRSDFKFDYQDGWFNSTGVSSAFQSYNFKRAPSFFDEVCYTGTGSATTFSHNLGVAPELMIVKVRSGAANDWAVYSSTVGASQYFTLNGTFAPFTLSSIWNSTAPTSSVFTVGTNSATNGAGQTYVAYLFASCTGVSKVGSYTGTGATQTISCGFTGGARFVLIRRTDSTGDWYVWDTARGMVAGTDPSLLLNSTAAEVNANSIYTTTGGFQIVSTATGINASGGSYIYFSVA